MRVRTGRFRLDSGLRRGVQNDPLFSKIRNSLLFQPRIIQSAMKDTVFTHPPVAFAAARRPFGLFGRDAQGDQSATPRARLFPLLPVIQPHPPTYPTVENNHLFKGSADPEV